MNGLKKIFFTSDLHHGHRKSLEFDKRPFTDLFHMHRVLMNNFNNTVPKDGLTYFLGDVGFSKGDELRDFVTKLNGTKVLVLGNHDKGANAMYNVGFDVVLYGAKLVIASQIVTLSHCPLKGLYREDTAGMKGGAVGENWHGESREKFACYTQENFGQFHLHGHVHSPNGGKSQKILDKQFDVGVVANNYTPVNISVIESWIAKYGR
jgi:calcineurin-like phosphoesterase family protein